MDDAEERLKAVMTPELDRRIKELMTSAKSKNDVRSVSNEVAEAIASLYVAFSRYSMSDPFNFCDHCVRAEEIDNIRGTPLRDLTFDQLWTIASNIVLTIGEVSDFQTFPTAVDRGLPIRRFLRHRGRVHAFSEHGVRDMAKRRTPGGPELHPQSVRREPTSVVNGSGRPTNMDDLLCCAYYAGTLPELLRQWTSDTRETARQQLLEWALSAFGLPDDPYAFIDGPPAPIKPNNAYYDARGREALLTWLRTSEAQRALSEACALRADLPSERRGRLERILSASREAR